MVRFSMSSARSAEIFIVPLSHCEIALCEASSACAAPFWPCSETNEVRSMVTPNISITVANVNRIMNCGASSIAYTVPPMKRKSVEKTKTQGEDARRLKARWDEIPRDAPGGLSQEEFAARYGITQSAVSQYLHGKIPLNMTTAIKFAIHLNCKVVDFSPTIATEIIDAATRASHDLFIAKDGVEKNMLKAFSALEPSDQQDLLGKALARLSDRIQIDQPNIRRLTSGHKRRGKN